MLTARTGRPAAGPAPPGSAAHAQPPGQHRVRIVVRRVPGDPVAVSPSPCRPHSVLPVPAQRPARASSPQRPWVHGASDGGAVVTSGFTRPALGDVHVPHRTASSGQRLTFTSRLDPTRHADVLPGRASSRRIPEAQRVRASARAAAHLRSAQHRPGRGRCSRGPYSASCSATVCRGWMLSTLTGSIAATASATMVSRSGSRCPGRPRHPRPARPEPVGGQRASTASPSRRRCRTSRRTRRPPSAGSRGCAPSSARPPTARATASVHGRRAHRVRPSTEPGHGGAAAGGGQPDELHRPHPRHPDTATARARPRPAGSLLAAVTAVEDRACVTSTPSLQPGLLGAPHVRGESLAGLAPLEVTRAAPARRSRHIVGGNLEPRNFSRSQPLPAAPRCTWRTRRRCRPRPARSGPSARCRRSGSGAGVRQPFTLMATGSRSPASRRFQLVVSHCPRALVSTICELAELDAVQACGRGEHAGRDRQSRRLQLGTSAAGEATSVITSCCCPVLPSRPLPCRSARWQLETAGARVCAPYAARSRPRTARPAAPARRRGRVRRRGRGAGRPAGRDRYSFSSTSRTSRPPVRQQDLSRACVREAGSVVAEDPVTPPHLGPYAPAPRTRPGRSRPRVGGQPAADTGRKPGRRPGRARRPGRCRDPWLVQCRVQRRSRSCYCAAGWRTPVADVASTTRAGTGGVQHSSSHPGHGRRRPLAECHTRLGAGHPTPPAAQISARPRSGSSAAGRSGRPSRRPHRGRTRCHAGITRSW